MHENSFVFGGFEYPDANCIFCPNQLFDLALSSLSTVHEWRLLCYVIHETLSTLDRNGVPVRQDIEISRNELHREARIGRQEITATIDSLVRLGFFAHVSEPVPNSNTGKGKARTFRLAWDLPAASYTKNLDYFHGFFAGEGNRTAIPKDFFTKVVPFENHACNKIVGAVLRHTVGFQNQFGGRVEEAPLSFEFIKQFTNIRSDSTINDALKHSIERKYIERTKSGTFSFDPAMRSPSFYTVYWLKGTKSVVPQGDEIRSSKSGQNPKQQGDENPSSNYKNSVAATGDEIRSNINLPILKQQTEVVDQKCLQLLLAEGFKKTAALQIVKQADSKVIENQIASYQYWKSTGKGLGFLRKAIAENWDEPEHLRVKRQRSIKQRRENSEQSEQQQAEQRFSQAIGKYKAKLIEIWFSLSVTKREELKQRAVLVEADSVKAYLQKKSVDDKPVVAFLNQVASLKNMRTVVEFETEIMQNELRHPEGAQKYATKEKISV